MPGQDTRRVGCWDGAVGRCRWRLDMALGRGGFGTGFVASGGGGWSTAAQVGVWGGGRWQLAGQDTWRGEVGDRLAGQNTWRGEFGDRMAGRFWWRPEHRGAELWVGLWWWRPLGWTGGL